MCHGYGKDCLGVSSEWLILGRMVIGALVCSVFSQPDWISVAKFI